MPLAAASPASAAAVNAPSASLPPAASAGLAPAPRRWPKAKLRDCGEEAVSTRSPRPESPIRVSGRPPKGRAKRISSAKARAISAARALSPSPRPATIPQAIASTFLPAPPISTPRTSSVW
ncbi:hypothetical protein SR39_09165 [Methylobacterium radiotolerans]|nr:hypothetical protein SR39_09165 [Methylobacterium radiotolerans]